MAHAVKLGQLTDGLITSIAATPSDDSEAKQLHDRTLKGLKNTSHARTNPFKIKAKLDGLVEKFAVLNRDDLSEGLQSRGDQLPEKSKWLPEILSLLLELSDRPLEKTRLEDVEAASRLDDGDPALTWAEIVADDPLDEAGIWDDVERGYHSSDDDFTTDQGGSGDETQATSITEDDPVTLARMHVVQVDEEVLKPMEDAQKRLREAPAEAATSELTLIRETLCMLHGLPIDTYDLDHNGSSVSLGRDLKLSTASRQILQHTLQQLADLGSSLNTLRLWTKKEQTARTLLSCQAAMASQMTTLAARFASLEQRYLTPSEKGVASLMDVHTDVESLTQPFLLLSRAVRGQNGDNRIPSVALLNKLYDETCIAQLSGDQDAFCVLSTLLFAGLETYLRPISQWITDGECDNDDDFFIIEVNKDCELGRLWHDRYDLRQGADGEPAAPVFLRPFVSRIFALGKGRAFLKVLSRAADDAGAGLEQSVLDTRAEQNDLLLFSQILADALEAWITEQSRDQTPLLRTAILHEHGLLSAIDAMQDVFFSNNGRRFQTFADTLFWRMDNRVQWRDSFLLTELAQSTLGSAEGVIAESLAVMVGENNTITGKAPSIVSLQDVQLHYHLPWPPQNVTASASSYTHSRAFTILLQIYRAKYLLRQNLSTTLRHLNAQAPSQGLPPGTAKALRLHQNLTTLIDILHAHITTTSSLLSLTLKHDLAAAEDLDAMAAVWTRHEAVLEVSLLVAKKLGPVREAVVGILGMCERVAGLLMQMTQEGDRDGSGVEEMGKELKASLSFVTAGVRGIGRAGGNSALEQLAERVEWAVH